MGTQPRAAPKYISDPLQSDANTTHDTHLDAVEGQLERHRGRVKAQRRDGIRHAGAMLGKSLAVVIGDRGGGVRLRFDVKI